MKTQPDHAAAELTFAAAPFPPERSAARRPFPDLNDLPVRPTLLMFSFTTRQVACNSAVHDSVTIFEVILECIALSNHSHTSLNDSP